MERVMVKKGAVKVGHLYVQTEASQITIMPTKDTRPETKHFIGVA